MDKYLIALSYLECLGPATLKKLILALGSAEAVFKATKTDFKKIQLNSDLAVELCLAKNKLDPEKIILSLKKENVFALSVFEGDYPKILKEIYQPPLVLFYKGNIELLKAGKTLGVVGSRKISPYLKNILPELLAPVIKQNAVVVSGLAYGVDQLAHELALANYGLTIGVLAGGLSWEEFYPQTNLNLAKKIIKDNGLILSEFPPYFPIRRFSFPRRNRIIAGLSQAVLIAEAALKSGALITAAFALEQNREVLAIPQNINGQNSAGVNQLIKNGAKAVTSSEDILETLGLLNPPDRHAQNQLKLLSGAENLIYNCLSSEPCYIDKIQKQCNLEISLLSGFLIKMEIQGLIKNIGQQNYIKL